MTAFLAVFLFILFFAFILDFFFPMILIGVFVVVVMSATHMIEWDGNKADLNIQRGIEWMKNHDGNGNWVGPETDADKAAKRQLRMQDDEVIIVQ